MQIIDSVQLDFSDVLIKPRRSSIDSRSKVDLKREYKFKWCPEVVRGTGIMQANIDLGRNYGDELLNIVAKRICSVLEENGTAFRISGTEYAIILLNGVNIMI